MNHTAAFCMEAKEVLCHVLPHFCFMEHSVKSVLDSKYESCIFLHFSRQHHMPCSNPSILENYSYKRKRDQDPGFTTTANRLTPCFLPGVKEDPKIKKEEGLASF